MCSRSLLRLVGIASLTVAAPCVFPGSAQAANVTWRGTTSGDWSVGSNWSSGTAPVSGDLLFWNNTSTLNLTSTNTSLSGTFTLSFNSNIPGNVSLSGGGIALGADLQQAFTGTVTIGMDLALPGTRVFWLSGTTGGRMNLNGVLNGIGQVQFRGPNTGGGAESIYVNGLNSFNAPAYVRNTTVYINTLGNSGVAQSLGQGTEVAFGYSNVAGTGNVIYTGTTASTNKKWAIGQGDATLVNGGFFNNGTGAVTWTGSQATVTATVARTFTLGGSNVDNNTWQTAIKDNTGVGGVVNFTKSGAGKWILSGVNTYSGSTSMTGGRLEISAAGSINSTSGITVNGSAAEFKYNSSTALTKPLTLTQGILSGTGTISSTGGVSVATNAILSPGNSPGTQIFTTGLTLLPGGTYVWETNSGTGTKGVNWDLIDVTAGGLNLSSLSSGGTFTLDLTTLTASGSSGPMDNYTAGGSYTWRIFDANALTLPGSFGSAPYAAGTDITSLFNLVTTNWKNPVPESSNLAVKVAADGTGIDLVVVPEPATVVLAGLGVGIVGLIFRNRLRRA